jgi:hypothetical protein
MDNDFELDARQREVGASYGVAFGIPLAWHLACFLESAAGAVDHEVSNPYFLSLSDGVGTDDFIHNVSMPSFEVLPATLVFATFVIMTCFINLLYKMCIKTFI